MAFRYETLTIVLALALFGCGGHSRSNASGRGSETTKTEPNEPELTEPERSRLIKVSLNESSACTLSSDGGVACFELEQGFESATAPVVGKFRDLAGNPSAGANDAAGAALREDGSVATWGGVQPQFPPLSFTRIAFDHLQACGIKTDGSILCSSTAEQRLESLPGNFQQLIVAGDGSVCGLTTEGALRCQTTPPLAIQPPENDLPPLREVSIDPTGTMGGCGIDLGGALHCWGSYCPIPGTFLHVSLSYFDACALTTEGEIQCWNYRLAQDDCTADASAIKLSQPPSGKFTQLASALTKKCAIEAGGENVRCWGL